MNDSDFWRDLAERFRAIPDYQMLRADWEQTVIIGEQRSELAQWRLAGLDRNTRSMQVDYIALARRGAKVHPKMDSLDRWLEALRSQQLKAEVNGTGLETNLDGTLVAHHYSGSIMRVCQAS